MHFEGVRVGLIGGMHLRSHRRLVIPILRAWSYCGIHVHVTFYGDVECLDGAVLVSMRGLQREECSFSSVPKNVLEVEFVWQHDAPYGVHRLGASQYCMLCCGLGLSDSFAYIGKHIICCVAFQPGNSSFDPFKC